MHQTLLVPFSLQASESPELPKEIEEEKLEQMEWSYLMIEKVNIHNLWQCGDYGVTKRDVHWFLKPMKPVVLS